MSSVRIVSWLGIKRCSRLSSLLRCTSEPLPSTLAVKQTCIPSHCYSSKYGNEARTLRKAIKNDLDKSDAQPSHATQTSDTEKAKSSKTEELFDEVIELIQKPFSATFIKDCEWRLLEWGRVVKELQNAGQPVVLDKVVSGNFPKVVQFVLTPEAPASWRHKILVLLLSQAQDNTMMQEVLSQTLLDAIYLPINVVADIIQSLSSSAETLLRKQARKAMLSVIVNRRWCEITPKYTLFFMYQLDELFDMKSISQQLRKQEKETNTACGQAFASNTETKATDIEGSQEKEFSDQKSYPILSVNLEARIISLADELKVKDLARVVRLLAKWRNRNETLLHAVIHRLSQADLSSLNFIQLNNLLYSCSVLNLYNESFLRKLISSLSQTSPTSPALANAVLISLSHLRWSSDPGLISKYVHYLKEHISKLSTRDCQKILVSLANLYSLPRDEEEEANFVKDLVSRILTEDVPAPLLVNSVWCLAILKSLSPDMAALVLEPDFVQQFLDSNDVQNQVTLQKLSGINNCAKFELPGYSGPFLRDKSFLNVVASPSCSDETLKASLINALRKHADLNSYIKLTHHTGSGIVIDVLMCANSEGNVRPLALIDDAKAKSKLYKLAIQLIPFTGVMNPTQVSTGAYQMTARHLKHLGYVPVQIPYSDLKSSQGVLEHINNIKNRISAAVAECR